ncbi:hypothetical protein BH11PAT1_BH11PAT1_3920 [soil metagenome]
MKITMRYSIILIFILLTTLIILPEQVKAAPTVAGSSAALTKENSNSISLKVDTRAKILEKYLKKYDSPLAPYAKTFVAEADRNDIDWKLLVAISGVESTFGKQIPHNSYNGWGWGIYGDQTHGFASWDAAILTISKGLRDNYMNKWGAKDIDSIGRIYAANPAWANRVTYFSEQIDTFAKQQNNTQLSISL